MLQVGGRLIAGCTVRQKARNVSDDVFDALSGRKAADGGSHSSLTSKCFSVGDMTE